jgi:endonuclease/exonuclease/phosphatase family metal-dependent hydrolase
MRRFAATLLIVVLAGLAGLAGAAELRVMSFNIRYGTADDGDDAWPARQDLVIRTIETAAPDLLGTQECLDFQRDLLAAALPAYAVIGVGRDDGADGGEMCACFYRADRFALRDQGTFWLSETPEEVGSRGWDAVLPRIATWLRLHDRSTGRELLWLNTHLDHRGEQARLASLSLIARWLAVNRQGASLVVTGDFNLAVDASPDGPQARLRGDLLVDTWTVVHGPEEPADGTFNGFGVSPRPGRIDWILASADLAVKEAGVVRTRYEGRWPSDHCPVTATLVVDESSRSAW